MFSQVFGLLAQPTAPVTEATSLSPTTVPTSLQAPCRRLKPLTAYGSAGTIATLSARSSLYNWCYSNPQRFDCCWPGQRRHLPGDQITELDGVSIRGAGAMTLLAPSTLVDPPLVIPLTSPVARSKVGLAMHRLLQPSAESGTDCPLVTKATTSFKSSG